MTGALLLYSADHAADIKDRTIKFAFVQNIDNYWGAGAEKFAEVVEEKSGGKIKLSPGGVLGEHGRVWEMIRLPWREPELDCR